MEVVESSRPGLRLQRQVVPSGLLGMLIFVVAETMFFAAFMSAFTIVRAGTPPGLWPPPQQPRLPIESTALNTAALLASAPLLFLAQRTFSRGRASASVWLLGAFGLGASFVALQGIEWFALLRQGLTLTSSTLGSFFYLIVGTHAAHAIAALLLLLDSWIRLVRGKITRGHFAAAQVFWYFVVAMWPVIYLRVYFG